MNTLLILASLLLLSCTTVAPAPQSGRATEHVFLVMTDGLRWQEFFNGADSAFVADPTSVPAAFMQGDSRSRRQSLLPFIWNTIAAKGVILGDPSAQSRFAVANDKNFSYPGYDEALTGQPDPAIQGNDPIPNENLTILDRLATKPGFEGRVVAIASWDVMHAIINARSPDLLVLGGGRAPPDSLGGGIWGSLRRIIAEVQDPWDNVQFDALTHEEALQIVEERKPKLLFVAYGETDEWGHKHDYLSYLQSARRFDDYVRQLWEKAQSMDELRGHTTIIVTTDHGRGADAATWHTHGRKVPESGRTWLAMMGPDTRAQSGSVTRDGRLEQVAATIYQLLGLDLSAENAKAAKALEGVVQ